MFDFLRYALPFFIFVLAGAIFLLAAVRRGVEHLPIEVTFFCAYLLHYFSAHIQVNTNAIFMALYAAMLGSLACLQLRNMAGHRASVLLDGGALLLAALLFAAFFARPFYDAVREYHKHEAVASALPKISGIGVSPQMERELTEIVSLVDAYVPPGRRIFVGLHRHDITVIGDGKMYFILDRLNATRHDQLHPGILDTEERQAEMIEDLQERDVNLVIKYHVFSDKILGELKKERAKTLPDTGAEIHDEYIDSHFREARRIGQHEIWLRNDVALH